MYFKTNKRSISKNLDQSHLGLMKTKNMWQKKEVKKENPKVLGIPLSQYIPQTLHQTMVAIVKKMGWDVKSHLNANPGLCKFANENNYNFKNLKFWILEFLILPRKTNIKHAN